MDHVINFFKQQNAGISQGSVQPDSCAATPQGALSCVRRSLFHPVLNGHYNGKQQAALRDVGALSSSPALFNHQISLQPNQCIG
jgi:hypothetical protein